MTADFFRATLTASSNDVQEKSDHGKKEQVEEAQVEASGGEGQAQFGHTHEEERRKKEITADEGKEKGSGKGKEGRQKSSAKEEGDAGSAEARCEEGRCEEGRTEAETCANDPGNDGTACNAGLGARNASGNEFRRGIIGNVDSAGEQLGAYQPL